MFKRRPNGKGRRFTEGRGCLWRPKFGEAGACNGTLDLDLTLATIRQAQPGAHPRNARRPATGGRFFWKVAGRHIEEVEAPIMTRVATRAVLAV
jgi:hypothetical protein